MDAGVLRDARGIDIQKVVSARELHSVMKENAQEADILVMAAAVADFRPASVAASKQKKNGSSTRALELVENPDILADLAQHRQRKAQLIVGFAAETGDSSGSVLEYGRAKAARKGADLMVINEVGGQRGFGNVDTAITMIDAAGTVHGSGEGSKPEMASLLFDTILNLQESM